MGKIEVLNLVLTKLDIELGLAQPQLVLIYLAAYHYITLYYYFILFTLIKFMIDRIEMIWSNIN